MKQLTQRMKDGQLRTVDVPPPELDDWKVLVRTQASLVSAGTERAKIEVARESLLGKARRRPDQVRDVMAKVRTDGLVATVDAVRNRLEALSPLGYCAVGRVERVGARVREITPGDMVACGGEQAAHAELLSVSGNLCVRVPSVVDPVAGAFTTLGAIALHGFHQADAGVGERVAVIGMGLVGQLSAGIAHASGCEVLGVDLEDWRLEVARRAGYLDFSRLRNAVGRDDLGSWDVVLVTAAAARSNDPVSLATDLARERGRIVVVGDVRLELDRRRLYEKELELRLARSYGPGRYDDEYEKRGLDYPIGYVRWTEQRNMSSFLKLLASRSLEVDHLITHRFTIDDGPRALAILTEPAERALGVLIEYPDETTIEKERSPGTERRRATFSPGKTVAFIGAGSFARRQLMPLARRHGLLLDRVATASGLSAVSAAEQFGFRRGACTVAEVLADDSIAGIVVATRHDRHADLTLEGLRAGKAVFVEKPLCLREDELTEIRQELEGQAVPPLMVGFNRRLAPLTTKLREQLASSSGPLNVLMRVNAGTLPADHWLNDPREGGGRLLGEGCHFLDLMLHLVGADPIAVAAHGQGRPDEPLQSVQDFSVTVRFADRSLGTLLYGTAGSPKAGKEFIEAHRGEMSLRIDDFRALRIWTRGRVRTERSSGRDKGHSEEMRLFAEVVRGESPPPAWRPYLISTALTLAALRSLQTGIEERVGVAEDGSSGLDILATEDT